MYACIVASGFVREVFFRSLIQAVKFYLVNA